MQQLWMTELDGYSATNKIASRTFSFRQHNFPLSDVVSANWVTAAERMKTTTLRFAWISLGSKTLTGSNHWLASAPLVYQNAGLLLSILAEREDRGVSGPLSGPVNCSWVSWVGVCGRNNWSILWVWKPPHSAGPQIPLRKARSAL